MNVTTERSSSCAAEAHCIPLMPRRDTRQELGRTLPRVGGMDMSVCQTGVPCVWGRRHADTVVCSLPRCVVFQLRTGYLDRLRGGWVKYGVFQKEVERIGVEVESDSTDSASAEQPAEDLLPKPAMMSHSS